MNLTFTLGDVNGQRLPGRRNVVEGGVEFEVVSVEFEDCPYRREMKAQVGKAASISDGPWLPGRNWIIV